MKKSTLVVVVSLLGAIPAVCLASAAIRLTFEQLVLEADRVVEAKLSGEGVSAWGPDRHRIFTTYTFEVEQDVAGEGPREFLVVQPGGRVGRLAQKTEGYPSFRKGDRVLLFLRKVERSYRVVGLSQGVFGYHQDGARMILHQKLEGLHFPDDPGRPLLMELPEALRTIRNLWRERKAAR